jgi:CTP synthase
MDPETPYAVIDLLPEQKEIEDLGGTMRLGAQAVELGEGTLTREIYGEATIQERHRHRYEVNNQFRDQLIASGLVVSGTFQEGRLVEIVELPEHPWFVASQFHPEFKSRPTRPAPLFRGFVGAALERARTRSAVAVAAEARR